MVFVTSQHLIFMVYLTQLMTTCYMWYSGFCLGIEMFKSLTQDLSEISFFQAPKRNLQALRWHHILYGME